MDSSNIQKSELCSEKRWPDSAAEHDLEGFVSDDSAHIDEVVSMGKVWDSKWKEKMFMNF